MATFCVISNVLGAGKMTRKMEDTDLFSGELLYSSDYSPCNSYCSQPHKDLRRKVFNLPAVTFHVTHLVSQA